MNITELNKLIGNETISLFLNCKIKYSGRAESFLDSGDRLLIIKQDGTLLVHQPEGNNAINYMKAGSLNKIEVNEDSIKIVSSNQKLKENLEITGSIYDFQSKRLLDGKKLELKGNEADMSDLIYDNPSLIEEGFKPLSREEHTKHGFIDVFGYDANNNLVVIECKRYTADFNAVEQLKRYVEKIKKIKGLMKVRGIIASPSITGNALLLLQDYGFRHVRVEPPRKHELDKQFQKELGTFT